MLSHQLPKGTDSLHILHYYKHITKIHKGTHQPFSTKSTFLELVPDALFCINDHRDSDHFLTRFSAKTGLLFLSE